jgi:hypothetical protein
MFGRRLPPSLVELWRDKEPSSIYFFQCLELLYYVEHASRLLMNEWTLVLLSLIPLRRIAAAVFKTLEERVVAAGHLIEYQPFHLFQL